jgi:hypothetical protein
MAAAAAAAAAVGDAFGGGAAAAAGGRFESSQFASVALRDRWKVGCHARLVELYERL